MSNMNDSYNSNDNNQGEHNPVYPPGVQAYIPPYKNNPDLLGNADDRSATEGSLGQKRDFSQYDFEEIKYPARIAVWDDLHSSPQVVTVEPCGVAEYLNQITQATYDFAHDRGGNIPYTVIRELVENFIHAFFIEPTVTILDGGQTIRFTDQGPGISNIPAAKKPGVTSANHRMKKYIRGVGSGLPIVNEYLTLSGGSLSIENNIQAGCIVTISVKQQVEDGVASAMGGSVNSAANPAVAPVMAPSASLAGREAQAGQMPQAFQNLQGQPFLGQPSQSNVYHSGQPYPVYPPPYAGGVVNQTYNPALNQGMSQPMTQPFTNYAAGMGYPQSGPAASVELSSRQKQVLELAYQLGKIGPTEIKHHLGITESTAHRELSALERGGFLVAEDFGAKKRSLTPLGLSLFS